MFIVVFKLDKNLVKLSNEIITTLRLSIDSHSIATVKTLSVTIPQISATF